MRCLLYQIAAHILPARMDDVGEVHLATTHSRLLVPQMYTVRRLQEFSISSCCVCALSPTGTCSISKRAANAT